MDEMTDYGRRSPALRGATYRIDGHPALPNRVCIPRNVEVQR